MLLSKFTREPQSSSMRISQSPQGHPSELRLSNPGTFFHFSFSRLTHSAQGESDRRREHRITIQV